MKSPCLLLIIVAVFGSVVVAQAQPTLVVPTCSGNATVDTAALTKLQASLGSTTPATIQFPSKTATTELCRVSSITFSSNITLDFTKGGVQIVTGQTFTAQGPLIAPAKQIFFNALSGQGAVVAGGAVSPDWWASNSAPGTTDMTVAINAADASVCSGSIDPVDGVTVAAQGSVRFQPTVYKITGLTFRGAPWDLNGATLDYYGTGAAVTAVGTLSARKQLNISNGTILGSHASAGGYGLRLANLMRSFNALNHVLIEHFPAHGIYWAGDSWQMSFYDVAIVACAHKSGSGIGIDRAVGTLNQFNWFNLQLENNGQAGSATGGGIESNNTGVHQWDFFGGAFQGNKGDSEVRFTSGSSINMFGTYLESGLAADGAANGMTFAGASTWSAHGMSFFADASHGGSAVRALGDTVGVLDNPVVHSNWPTTINLGDSAQVWLLSNGNLTPGARVSVSATAKLFWPINQNLLTTSGATFATLGFTASPTGPGTVADFAAAPTINSGFGTSPSIVANNGTVAFTVNVGTGRTASRGVIGMPSATTGWICNVENQTGVASNRADQRTVQTASTTKTVTVQNQTVSTGAALPWTAADVLTLQCRAY